MAEKTGDFSIFELAESVNTESEKKNVCLKKKCSALNRKLFIS